MAGTKPNFRLSTLRMLLLNAAAFILLSASQAVAESRRCYWCGPLAEQVHRSRRAPPCDSPGDHITTCEPGLTDCATVATSPLLDEEKPAKSVSDTVVIAFRFRSGTLIFFNQFIHQFFDFITQQEQAYIESRYCVKLYQDECYPLFCNTTKTWKMTCPCRGDLCNGPNTEREIEAFAILSRLVAKTHNARIKKRTTKSSSNFIQSEETKVQIIISNSTGAVQNNITNENTNSDDNESMQADEPISIHIGDGKGGESTTEHNNSSPELNTETSKSSNIVNVADPEEKDNQQSPSNNLPEMKSTTESSIITTEKDKNNAETPSQTTQIDKNSKVSVKSTEELPTAEALQHNVNPEDTDEKTTELIKTDPTYATTQIVVNTTPKARAHGKNNAALVSLNSFLLVHWVILYSLL